MSVYVVVICFNDTAATDTYTYWTHSFPTRRSSDLLRVLGATEAPCVVADDDESFTYNKRVNRLATIQEHYMIVRALDRGVSEEKLARALNVDVKVIRQRRHLLSGIRGDVADMLKDKPVGLHAFKKLPKMKPIRHPGMA